MTTTADTPLQRAAKAIAKVYDCAEGEGWEVHQHQFGEAARAALVAALQVRWESVDSRTYQWAAFIGHLFVGRVYREEEKQSYIGYLAPNKWVGRFTLPAEAKSAVQRAVIEAILGDSL